MGFSQNDSCSKPTWRTTRPASLQPRKLPRCGVIEAAMPGSESGAHSPDLVRPR